MNNLKYVVVFFVLLIAGLAQAGVETVDLVYSKDAVIVVPDKKKLGDAVRIDLGEDSYILAPLGSARTSYLQIVDNLEQYKQTESTAGGAVGFIAKEKGHFPNPEAEFEVFKAISLDMPLLKGIQPAK